MDVNWVGVGIAFGLGVVIFAMSLSDINESSRKTPMGCLGAVIGLLIIGATCAYLVRAGVL